MALDFRVAEVSQAVPPRPVLTPGGAAALPGGSGAFPLTGWDPFAGTGGSNFCWNVADHGWDEGAWYGRPEWLLLRLAEGLELRVGRGAASFSRASSTTRTNEDGDVEAVAAHTPAWDWLEGPGGVERYCLRADQADALLTVPTARNLRRRGGALTLWLRPQWDGSPSEGTDRILWQCGNWKLWKAAGTTELRWQVPLQDGTLATASYDVSGFTADEWYWVGADWSRADGRIRLWTDGALRDTEVTAQRYADHAAAAGIGQGSAAGLPANAHLVDFRFWPLPLTATLAETLYAVKA